ncbi:hypothetical protein ABN702_12570 [Bacillus haimaensis]|uniref:hypothetical protein n=1 Tax=Bacillus haimaensis TaxID=3160967 RepID=UPI003AA81748
MEKKHRSLTKTKKGHCVEVVEKVSIFKKCTSVKKKSKTDCHEECKSHHKCNKCKCSCCEKKKHHGCEEKWKPPKNLDLVNVRKNGKGMMNGKTKKIMKNMTMIIKIIKNADAMKKKKKKSIINLKNVRNAMNAIKRESIHGKLTKQFYIPFHK